jgi:CheY-like chemotaxis protein
MTITVGFIDDSSIELESFRRVAGAAGYRVVVSTAVDDFLEQLARIPRIDLLLFDLYFPRPGQGSGGILSTQDLTRLSTPIAEHTAMLRAAATEEEQLALADFVRRDAQRVMSQVLDHYGQGPDGGLAIHRRVCEQYPLVPTAFLSRKRTAEDVVQCTNAGAIDVLLKPAPTRSYQNCSVAELALWGWEDNWTEYSTRFRQLADVDVVDAVMRRAEDSLATHGFSQASILRESILRARAAWLAGGDEAAAQVAQALTALTTTMSERFGGSPAYDLLSAASRAVDAVLNASVQSSRAQLLGSRGVGPVRRVD